MAGGFAVTKEPATDMFAKRFCDAGFAVLAFDYRRLGESGGLPRQVVRIREQLADWQAAIGFAATLPGVDPARLAVWGFSASGGHIFSVAARNPGLAAAIAQSRSRPSARSSASQTVDLPTAFPPTSKLRESSKTLPDPTPRKLLIDTRRTFTGPPRPS
jgi:dienelactone hydrolase